MLKLKPIQKVKRLVLKLGSQCNWHCKHCHNKEVNYKYNSDIIPYIKNNGYKRITFSGGEPLLYFNTIKKVCEALGKDYHYRLVTNGSLLDREIVSFIGDYNINVILSFDGSDGHRTEDPPIQWRLFANCKHTAFSTVVYHDNLNFEKIHSELLQKCDQYRIKPKLSLQPEFIHQTAVSSPNDNTTREDAKKYCLEMAKVMEAEILSLLLLPTEEEKIKKFYDCNTLRKAIGKWLYPYPKQQGLRCFNETVQNLTLDGRFILCPYSDAKVVGDIYQGVDWEKVNSFIPNKCRNCFLLQICRGACVENVTDNECYISQTMNRWLEKVTQRYNCKEELLRLWEKTKP